MDYNYIMYYTLRIMHNFYSIIMLYIDMLSIIVHDTCIHHTYVCDFFKFMYSVILLIHALLLYSISIDFPVRLH